MEQNISFSLAIGWGKPRIHFQNCNAGIRPVCRSMISPNLSARNFDAGDAWEASGGIKGFKHEPKWNERSPVAASKARVRAFSQIT